MLQLLLLFIRITSVFCLLISSPVFAANSFRFVVLFAYVGMWTTLAQCHRQNLNPPDIVQLTCFTLDPLHVLASATVVFFGIAISTTHC